MQDKVWGAPPAPFSARRPSEPEQPAHRAPEQAKPDGGGQTKKEE